MSQTPTPVPIAKSDHMQKTWIPEGTREYTTLKLLTQENEFLAQTIAQNISLRPGDLVLDVGGREGNVAFAVQEAEYVHIVDPDTTVTPFKKPGRLWTQKVQNVQFSSETKYKVIICCHVLGYLGLQGAQEKIMRTLTDLLEEGGTLILFYNTNQGYIGELIQYSKHILERGHYDFFEERLLDAYRLENYHVKQLDISFPLAFKTFDELARCCWFLFGAIDPHIEKSAKKFLPKLQRDLLKSTIMLDERIVFLTKQKETLARPGF